MKYVYQNSDIYQVLSPSFIAKFMNFTGISDASKLMVQVNPLTVDSSEFHYSVQAKQKEIIYVGRIDYNQKRVYRVIDTWALLERKFPDWKLTIVGDGPNKKDLEDQVEQMKLKHVSFEGFQNPIKYYKRASVLLLTSEYEGFGLVIVEGMSYGVVPIVYGSYSAVYDIIEDGIDGEILSNNQGFSAELMADKLLKVMENPILRNEMAQKAIAKSENYSIESVYESWNNLFNKLKENKE